MHHLTTSILVALFLYSQGLAAFDGNDGNQTVTGIVLSSSTIAPTKHSLGSHNPVIVIFSSTVSTNVSESLHVESITLSQSVTTEMVHSATALPNVTSHSVPVLPTSSGLPVISANDSSVIPTSKQVPMPTSHTPNATVNHSMATESPYMTSYTYSVIPSVSSAVSIMPNASIPHATSVTVPLSSSAVTPTVGPTIKYECGPECKSLKKRVLAATGFAVVLGIVCVVLAVLLWRQHRITRDSDDPALSRLI